MVAVLILESSKTNEKLQTNAIDTAVIVTMIKF